MYISLILHSFVELDLQSARKFTTFPRCRWLDTFRLIGLFFSYGLKIWRSIQKNTFLLYPLVNLRFMYNLLLTKNEADLRHEELSNSTFSSGSGY